MTETKAKILSIDDEQGIRDLLSFELSLHGYQVATAENGLEGIEKVKKEKFDLVILDIKMPGKDGIAALEIIKKIDPEIEVIIATGYGTMETAIESLRKGACDYIHKPFNSDELIILIEKILERRHFREIVDLYQISKAIFATIELDRLLKIIPTSARQAIKADKVSLVLLDEEGKSEILLSKESIDWLAKEKQSVLLIKGFENDSRFSDIQSQEAANSTIIAPLLGKNGLLGILFLYRVNIEHRFTRNDLSKTDIFASLVALSIENAKLYQKIQTTQAQIIQQSKLASLGELASGLAHELNNPMTAILGNAQILLSEIPKDNPWQADIKTIEESARRCKEIVNNMLILGRQHELN